MDSNSSDAELLARSVEVPALFAELYERHGQAVRRYVCRRVGDGPGDDVASEVFVRAFRARGRYRAERDVALPWLLGIANNVIADHRRLERRRLAGLERLIRHSPGLVEHHDVGLAPELVAALRELPASERDTLLLRDQASRKTAPLIDGQYFVLVERQTNNCEGCGQIDAINSTGRSLAANYGPERYRTP